MKSTLSGQQFICKLPNTAVNLKILPVMKKILLSFAWGASLPEMRTVASAEAKVRTADAWVETASPSHQSLSLS